MAPVPWSVWPSGPSSHAELAPECWEVSTAHSGGHMRSVHPGLAADHLGANPHSTARNRVTLDNRASLNVDFLAGTVGYLQLGTARSPQPMHTRLCPETNTPRLGPMHQALPQGTLAMVADL